MAAITQQVSSASHILVLTDKQTDMVQSAKSHQHINVHNLIYDTTFK